MWHLHTLHKLLIIVIIASIQALTIICNEYQNVLASLNLSAEKDEREGRSWRLPNTTYPLKYELHITTWIHQEIRNFTGNVTIDLIVKENTSELVLHARELNIEEISIEDLTIEQKIVELKLRIIDDLLVIVDANGNREIFVQNHQLRLNLHYTGYLNLVGEGFSVMSYRDENNNKMYVDVSTQPSITLRCYKSSLCVHHRVVVKNKTKKQFEISSNNEAQFSYGAYTDMEPLNARMVLPCYDEPALKANFAIRITHGSNYTAISNMPAIYAIENSSNKMTTTSFMETPQMSSYLLAFAVMNYKFVANESNGILQRVFLPPNTADTGNSALTHVIKVLETFAHYMDVPYTLPKLDHIIVEEFQASGMENMGLIIYKSSDFLFENASLLERFEAIQLVNHEIVHQWFGNLVSPEWWDSVWLNEGCATYYSCVLMEMLNPEYESMNDFTMKTCAIDELYTSLISVAEYVEKPDDIDEKFYFGPIYEKAPCIIKMFEHAFGEPIFRLGVSNYLKARAFSTANEDHLYDHLQAAMLQSHNGTWNYSVHEIMRPWLHGKTLPIVTITRDSKKSNIIYIQQRSSIRNVKEFWWIPLNFATSSQPTVDSTKAVYYMPPKRRVTLNLKQLNITLEKDDYLIANINNTGLYRVRYDNDNLLQIAMVLLTNHIKIGSLNRAMILSSIPDIWTEQFFALTTFEMLKYAPQEQDAFVWSAISKTFKSLRNMLSLTKTHELFDNYIRNQIRTQYLRYHKRSVEKLSYSESVMMRQLSELACDVQLPECLAQSRVLYGDQSKRIFSKRDNLNTEDYCNIAKVLSDPEFNEVLKNLKELPPTVFRNYWSSLLCTEKVTQYEKLLQITTVFVRDVADESFELLRSLADLLTTPNEMKWNSVYEFLQKQVLGLAAEPNAAFVLCQQMASNAEGIRKSYYVKYMELMGICAEQLKLSGFIRDNSDLVPNSAVIGAQYAFEDNQSWQHEMLEVYNWLKQQSY